MPKRSRSQRLPHIFKFDRKTNLPVNPTVQMVMLAPEEEAGPEDIMPLETEDSDSGESYEASLVDTPVSAGDIEVAVRVVHAEVLPL